MSFSTGFSPKLLGMILSRRRSSRKRCSRAMASQELNKLPPDTASLRAALVMNVRRPECDEQPSKPSSRNITTNQFTMLFAVIGPPRSEQTIGPKRIVSSLSSIRARRRSQWIGIRRPERFLAIASQTLSDHPMLPLPSSTIDHSSPAISQARRPALTASSMMTRLRRGYLDRLAYPSMRLSMPGVITLACRPAITLSLNGSHESARTPGEGSVETLDAKRDEAAALC